MRFFLKQKNQKWMRACALLLATVLLATLPITREKSKEVFADTREEWEDAKKELQETIDEIDDLESQAEQSKEDLEKASAALNKLIAAQEKLERRISACQDVIDENNIKLAAAQKKVDEEYESMKLRIQFMYENSSANSVWSAIISAGNFSEVLNRLEYITQVHETDRQLMDNYQLALEEVEKVSEELASNMEELLEMQSDYQKQQVAAEKTVKMLEKEQATYASQIANAKDKKEEYEESVSELGARVRAEEAAAAGQNADDYEGGGSGQGGLGDAGYLTDDSNDPSNRTSVSGEELVAYARQFVGAHYKWGGDVITYDWSSDKGIDCSGFVHMVYGHFGISTPRYSQSFKSVGQPVSYNNMRAGDVIVYPGHVAIYIGNGCIVEAQGSRQGVTDNRRADCHTITAIRRLI